MALAATIMGMVLTFLELTGSPCREDPRAARSPRQAAADQVGQILAIAAPREPARPTEKPTEELV
jgi:hypothetical protein